MKKPKTPQLKVPPILRDLYQDLRDRHLLPLVVLLLVAIVAVPFLLSDDAPKPREAAPRSAPSTATSGAQQASMAVVRAAPGLRAPKKRFEHRRPVDPFGQHHQGAAESQKSVTIESGEEGSAGDGEGEGGGAPTAPPPVTTVRSGIVFFATAAKVQIVRSETTADGKVVHQPPILRDRVLPSTTLLGEKAQIVTYMGPSPKTRNPMFLVADQVTAVFGEGNCLAGTERCQLIELEEGEPEVFVYGENDIRYRLTVLETELVETGRADRP